MIRWPRLEPLRLPDYQAQPGKNLNLSTSQGPAREAGPGQILADSTGDHWPHPTTTVTRDSDVRRRRERPSGRFNRNAYSSRLFSPAETQYGLTATNRDFEGRSRFE